MTVTPSAAAAAYQTIAKIGSEQAGAAAPVAGGDFSQFLSKAVHEAVSTMRSGEEASVKQVAGKGDIVNVVNAVNQAELTLDTVVAIRDKVIAAYQNVLQMPI
jgi:flagellar hook-basal body complex protein FliE